MAERFIQQSHRLFNTYGATGRQNGIEPVLHRTRLVQRAATQHLVKARFNPRGQPLFGAVEHNSGKRPVRKDRRRCVVLPIGKGSARGPLHFPCALDPRSVGRINALNCFRVQIGRQILKRQLIRITPNLGWCFGNLCQPFGERGKVQTCPTHDNRAL